MAQPETNFRLGVEKHLPPKEELHREKMSNPFSGGTADSWYSGKRADLWIEWKFIALPKRDTTLIQVGNLLSPLQLYWLAGRMNEGRNVRVVIGCKEGGVILSDRQWEYAWRTDDFRALLRSRQDIARFIREQCIGESQSSLHDGAGDDGGVPDHQHVDAAVRPRQARGAAKARAPARTKQV